MAAEGSEPTLKVKIVWASTFTYSQLSRVLAKTQVIKEREETNEKPGFQIKV
jgi:hypothetical protein